MSKEIKVETIKGITVITRLVIETMNKGIGRVKETEVGCMYHMGFMVMLIMI